MHVGPTAYAISTAIDALIACALVAWAVRRRPPLPLLLAGIALAIALVGVKLSLMVGAGLDRPFGVAHVLWLDAVVALPIAAVALALLGWRAGGWLLRGLVMLGLLLAPVGAYASFVEPQRLVLERAQVPLDQARAGADSVRVAVLADIQFDRLGEHEREAVARVMEQRPDVILLPGDYIDGSPAERARELPKLRELFARLRAPGGVFAVQGDQETAEQARAIFDGSGIRLLENELVTTRVGDRRITIAGIEKHYVTADARAAIRALEARPGARDVRILLAHRPDPVLRLRPETRLDLVVAGHTHGGQLQLPFLGPLRTASGVPREVAAGGLHTLDGRRIYVSRGVGVERGQAPKLRLGAPPEISLLELG
ncbi:MAG TPA: metallophosphoesterase [Conexibacter sp.]|nr:metallophosphoesterase [Conexibacter sp.]